MIHFIKSHVCAKLLAIVAMTASANLASAQVVVSGSNGPTYASQASDASRYDRSRVDNYGPGNIPATHPASGGSPFGLCMAGVPGWTAPVPVPVPVPRDVDVPIRNRFPVFVSPNEVIGINPGTGGLDTSNRQIDNTRYQPGRDGSQNNGTKRWVRRPVHNSQGQVVGYQEGWVWNHSITGQEHGELSNFTPNQKGGVHENIQSYSLQ